MENRISYLKSDAINNQQLIAADSPLTSLKKPDERSSDLRILAEEGFNDFVEYIEWLGFEKVPDLVILSSVRHYFYDAEELKKISTLVNLKELNRIRTIRIFIEEIFSLLPERSFFIGCFVDNKGLKSFTLRNGFRSSTSRMSSLAVENGITSRNPLLNLIYSRIDYKTYKYLSRNDVSLLLQNQGFKIIDMTEISGTTYFCAHKKAS